MSCLLTDVATSLKVIPPQHRPTNHTCPSPSGSVDSSSDLDSLFDEPLDSSFDLVSDEEFSNYSRYVEPPPPVNLKAARRVAPNIPGLYFASQVLLPEELEEHILQTCIDKYFHDEHVNQVMLFERVSSSQTIPSTTTLEQHGECAIMMF